MTIDERNTVAAAMALHRSEWLAEAGLAADAEGIRAGRRMIGALSGSPARQALERPEFYSASACRDMIFDVREHRPSLPRIGAMIDELASRASARANRARFTDDPTTRSLETRDAFESDHPGSLAGMFLFRVRDPGVVAEGWPMGVSPVRPMSPSAEPLR